MPKFILTAIILVSLLSPVGFSSISNLSSQSSVAPIADTHIEDTALAERYVPVLYFHPDEVYLPQSVDVVMGISRIRQSKRLWFDTTIMNKVTEQDLFNLPSDSTWFLDQWFGDTGSSEYGNYSFHHEIYDSSLSPDAGGPAPLVYAHVVHDETHQVITIQYWLFYFYNEWFNKHEGDWELVEVILSTDNQPAWVIYGQHHGGVRRSWETTPLEDGTHPVVYVSRGSHASYFAGDEVYPFLQPIGNRQLTLVDRTAISKRLIPDIIMLPTRAELAANPDAWPGTKWLMFQGRWGETAVYSDFNGPTGPADKAEQWDDPYVWGIKQPLDADTWYKNRLRVEFVGSAPSQAQVRLIDTAGQNLLKAETIGSLAILHTEPPEKLQVQVDGLPGALGNVIIQWPDRSSGTVTRTSYSGLVLDESGKALLELTSTTVVSLSGANRNTLSPTLLGIDTVTWDAPDVVWVAPNLPMHEIVAGLFLCLLISLLPVLLLIAILVWIDRYQKSPLKILAVSFAWGAIPALLVSFCVQLFFNPDPGLLGPYALETVRLGLIAPIVEEVLKAAGVLFIFWRYRKVFRDVLDGMLFGAMVGFGFAFISNLFRYTGDFLSLGFQALNLSFVVERTVHVLNHGLYTAIFGACLGFALLAPKRLRFWAIVLFGLVLAIATHALQNLLSNSLVGMNVFTVLVTIAGTLLLWVVAGWSLVQQHRLLRDELQGLVHSSLYSSVQNPLTRAHAQWNSLRRDGFRTWLRMRRLQGLCIELAHARLQERLHPEKFASSGEADALQSEIARIFDSLHPSAG